MLLVLGQFRFPPERVEEARPAMEEIIAQSRQEPGCIGYSYSEDICEPGLFHVTEAWTSHESLMRHFTTPHMQAWTELRETLGFHDRDVSAYEVGAEQAL